MKVNNPLASGKASGRALGGVFSSNRGMETFKKYVKPFQPNTVEQGEVKTRFSYLTKYWKTDLTYAQITLWNNWALPWTDIYGNAVLLTGINKFVICNDTLLRAGKPLTLIPPTATPSALAITQTVDPMFLKYSINGIPDAEVTAQADFIRIQVPGTPSRVEYIDGQLGIYWNGMPVSRTPLEKNWKTIFFYDCRTGFDGIEELKVIIQTENNLKGLQPIRFQRFNKFGYWSGKVEYINPITLKNLCQNSDFYAPGIWTPLYGASYGGGHGNFTNKTTWKLNVALVIGRTYRATFTVKFLTGGTPISCNWEGINLLDIYTDGTYSVERTIIASPSAFDLWTNATLTGWIDDVYIRDITP